MIAAKKIRLNLNKTQIVFIWSGILFCFGFTQLHSQIQINTNMTISVSATVEAAAQNVEFKPLQPLVINLEEATQDAIYVSPIDSPNAGLMEITAQPGSRVRINYLVSETLSENEGNGSIQIKYETSFNKQLNQKASEPNFVGEVVLQFDDSGRYYFWVGGRVSLNQASNGIYTGKFTLEIEYI